MRWEPGQVREVTLTSLAGRRRVYGFHGLVNGALEDSNLGEALARARAMGFLDSEE